METKQHLENNDENHDENNYTHQPIGKTPRSPKSTNSVNKGACKYGDKRRRKSFRPNQTVTTRPPGQPEKIIETKNVTNSHEGDMRIADEAT